MGKLCVLVLSPRVCPHGHVSARAGSLAKLLQHHLANHTCRFILARNLLTRLEPLLLWLLSVLFACRSDVWQPILATGLCVHECVFACWQRQPDSMKPLLNAASSLSVESGSVVVARVVFLDPQGIPFLQHSAVQFVTK